MAAAEGHFSAGQRELALGHADAAKREFNQATGVLLASPYGGRTEPRIRELFDRLVDRISTYEVKALAEGDGFAEKKDEPASLDQLLALSTTFGTLKPELKATVKADLQTAGHDIDIPLNERVLSYIELFQGRLHDFIEEGLIRGGKYLPMIQNVFRAEGLPLDLAYVPLIESAFKPNALSRAKARGVWQFMSGTALENGLRRDWYIDERSDPEKATVAAAKYLKMLNGLFSGDWHLALASYNGGPGRMQRAIKRVGVDDFWKLAEGSKVLPRETREYVPMILAAIVIARNPAQYGFEFEAETPAAYEADHAGPPGRSPAGRRMGRHDHRRDTGAQPGAPPLDHADPGRAVRPAGSRGHRRAGDGAAEGCAGNRRRLAEVVHRETRRHADDDCAQADGQQGRPRRGELLEGDRRCDGGREADRAA